MKWHLLSAEDVIEQLGSSQMGMPRQSPKGQGEIFPEQSGKTVTLLKPFLTAPLLVLFALTALAAFVADAHAVGYFALFALLVSVAIWYLASRYADTVRWRSRRLCEGFSRVIREGALYLVANENLVRGDVILLQKGDYVPADCRVMLSQALTVKESVLLSGSRAPREKTHQQMKDCEYFDANNMLWAGSVLESGSCRAVLCEVGVNTRLAAIGEKQADSGADRFELFLRKLSLITSSVLLGLLLIVSVFAFTPLSHGGLFEDWLLTVSLCGTAMSELLVLIYTVAGGLALFHSKSMITRRPSTLATLAKVDRVIVRASLFRDRASDGVTVLRLPSGEEETLSPMLSEDASRILRNAMIALGATARLGAQNAFVYGVKGLDDMVSEAFKKAELYLRAESYTVISADRTESGMYYGVFQRNGRYFLSLLAPTDQLLPLCSFGYRNNTIVGLSESSRRQAGKTVSEQGTVQYYGVAIGHLTDAVTETLDDAALSHLIEGGLVYEGAIGVFYKVNSCQPLESALSALNVSLTVMEDSEPIPRGASEYMPSPTRRTVYETIRAEQEAGHTVLFHAEALSDLALMKEADLSFTTGDAPSRERAIAVSGDQDGELLVHAPKVLRLFADWLLLKDKPDAAGSAIAHAIEEARGRYYRVLTALCYLFTVLPMKLVPLIGALITGKSLVSPILLFLLGLVFDTLAVMALLFKPCRERQKPYAIRVYCRQILAALGVGLLSGGCLLAGALVAEGVYLLSLELFATVLLFAASLLAFLTHYVSFEEGKRPRASLSLGTLLIVSGGILLFVLIFTRGSLGKGGFLCLAAALGGYLVLEGVSRLFLHRNMRKTSKRVQKSAKKSKKTSKKIDKTS